MIIIPAIDILGGKCVRLVEGDYSKVTVYYNDPVDAGKFLLDSGFTHLHVVDLDGAKAGKLTHYKILEKIARATNLVIDFSGGITDLPSAKTCFDFGANKITIGSVAVRTPETFIEFLKTFTPEKVILSADQKDGKVKVAGWKEDTQVTAQELIKSFTSHGLKFCMSTDISKDGLLTGLSLDYYKKLQDEVDSNIKIIASGGVSSIKDVEELKSLNLYGVIVGKALYEGLILPKHLLAI
jgi:phosphoribosylformimino-5-aminoimidazole carboxamide ribotide isomerase